MTEVEELERQVRNLHDLLARQKMSYELEIKMEVAAERERCARIVETQDTYGDPVGCWFETLASKIRCHSD